MMTGVLRVLPLLPFGSHPGARMVERSLWVYRHTWLVIFSGFFEPLFYLLGIGFGLGHLIGNINGLTYAQFVAPALLATAAMNGAIYDSTFNMFFKLKYAKTYDAMLSTPLGVGDVAIGEVTWALIRGTLYSLGFIVVIFVLGVGGSPMGAACGAGPRCSSGSRRRPSARRARRSCASGRTSTWSSW